jgi:hypothetical protein
MDRYGDNDKKLLGAKLVVSTAADDLNTKIYD